MKNKMKKYFSFCKREWKESSKFFSLLFKKKNKEEKTFFKRQGADIFKMLIIAPILALPGSVIILMVIKWIAVKLKIDIDFKDG